MKKLIILTLILNIMNILHTKALCASVIENNLKVNVLKSIYDNFDAYDETLSESTNYNNLNAPNIPDSSSSSTIKPMEKSTVPSHSDARLQGKRSIKQEAVRTNQGMRGMGDNPRRTIR